MQKATARENELLDHLKAIKKIACKALLVSDDNNCSDDITNVYNICDEIIDCLTEDINIRG